MNDNVPFEKALNISYRMLAFRDYSSKRLYELLKKRGVLPDIAFSVIEKLKESGYLNDSLFAQKYIERCLNRKLCGPFYLQAALLRAGVEREMAERTVCDCISPEKEKELAVALVRQMREKTEISSPEKLKRILKNRGFSPAICLFALQEDFGCCLDITP